MAKFRQKVFRKLCSLPSKFPRGQDPSSPAPGRTTYNERRPATLVISVPPTHTHTHKLTVCLRTYWTRQSTTIGLLLSPSPHCSLAHSLAHSLFLFFFWAAAASPSLCSFFFFFFLPLKIIIVVAVAVAALFTHLFIGACSLLNCVLLVGSCWLNLFSFLSIPFLFPFFVVVVFGCFCFVIES